MPHVRMLVSYPGDEHPSGSVIELEASQASQLVTEGRAEYVRELDIERAIPLQPIEVTTTRRARRRRK